jgi:hemerythrin
MENTINQQSSWDNNYKLDIPEIDSQHEQFFMLWDNAENYRLTNGNIDLEICKQIIADLEAYLHTHFSYEEELLNKSNYSDFSNHIRQHKYFFKKIEEFQIEFKSSNTDLFNQILIFIRKWFVSHILSTDQLFKDEVKEYLNKNHS